MEPELPAAPYPAPPPFWKHFTRHNVERSANLKPGEKCPRSLVYLRPPPPPSPAAESYDTFGIPQSLQLTLAPPPDELLLFDPNVQGFNPSQVLSQLTRSLLLNFLELTTILGNDPVQYGTKLSDITRIMYNIHYAINTYRPHQAREGVKDMLKQRLENGNQEIERCEQLKTRIEEFLRSIETRDEDKPVANGTANDESHEGDNTKALWKMIHSLEDD